MNLCYKYGTARKFFYSLLFICIYQHALSQSDWEKAGTIYSDSYVTVEMEYRPGKDICNTGLKPGRYRYKVTGTGRNTDYFVTWCMDYYDCKGNVICQTNNLNVGQFNGNSNLAAMDWTFESEKVETPFYDVTSDYKPTNRNPFIKQNPKLLPPVSISGNSQLKYGESTQLAIQGGNLSKGARWMWYTDQCGNNNIGDGKGIKIKPDKRTTVFVRGESPTEKTTCVSVTVEVNPDSESADDINVRRLSCTGIKTLQLSVLGGHLGQDANWVWFEDSCGSAPIGKGTSINVLPTRRTTYFVQAQGKSNTTQCRTVTVDVSEDAIDPSGINGPAFVCSGQQLNLEVMGGRLALGQQWSWYRNSLQPGNIIGTGKKINITAGQSGTYLVRAEGSCGTTGSSSIQVTVGTQSSGATYITGSSQVYQGKKLSLSLSGGQLGEGAKWVWYKNACGSGNRLGTGNQINMRVRKKQTIYARAEGTCGTSNCVSTTLTPLSRFVFLNMGYVANGSSNFNSITKSPLNDSLTYVITLGRVKAKGWYFRAKLSPKKRVSSFNKTNNESLLDYNFGTNFTRFSGEVVEDRFAISAGIIAGNKNLFYYTGLGYGRRDVYWGFDEFSVNNGAKLNTVAKYAKNIDLSISGLEVEFGLLVRLSFLNIMGGMSGILITKDDKSDLGHTDFHVGIGLSF
jgi:hypothetical protein